MNLTNRENSRETELVVTPNKIEAYLWYNLAASNGLRRAVFFRDQLTNDLTEPEITEADRLVAEWKLDPAECEKIGAQMYN